MSARRTGVSVLDVESAGQRHIASRRESTVTAERSTTATKQPVKTTLELLLCRRHENHTIHDQTRIWQLAIKIIKFNLFYCLYSIFYCLFYLCFNLFSFIPRWDVRKSPLCISHNSLGGVGALSIALDLSPGNLQRSR